MSRYFVHAALAAMLATMFVGGCKSEDKVEVSDEKRPYAETDLHKPDFVVVDKFAVTAEEVKVMRGLTPAISRGFSDQTQTEEEVRVGQALATQIQESLVKELNARGIKTYPTATAPEMTYKTGVVSGMFYEIDKGDRTARNLLGFGLGQPSMSMQVLFNEREVTIASETITTKTALKAGLLPGVAAIDEALHGTLKKEADAVAVKVADQVQAAYKKRGWLP